MANLPPPGSAPIIDQHTGTVSIIWLRWLADLYNFVGAVSLPPSVNIGDLILGIAANTLGTLPLTGTPGTRVLTNTSPLPTWSAITIVGTITTGTWAGSTITTTYGGTGLAGTSGYAILTLPASSGSPLGQITPGAIGTVLTSNGPSAAATFQSPVSSAGRAYFFRGTA